MGFAQVEALVARERQQLARELAAALAGAARDLGAALGHIVLRHQQDQVHAALDHIEQVVEVMRDAAGQAPDRFHLLVLRHRLLHALALDDLVHQAVVGLRQRAGALVDARFERFVQGDEFLPAVVQALRRALAVGQHVARLVLAAARAQGRDAGAAQRLRIERAFEQDHVAVVAQALAGRALLQADGLGQQHDERKVGPRRLRFEPGMQGPGIDVLQRFFGQDGRAGALFDRRAKLGEVGEGLALEAIALQHRRHDVGVAPARRENQDAFLARAARLAIARHLEPEPSWAWRRGSWGCRSARPRSPRAAHRYAPRRGPAAARGSSARAAWCGS